MIIAHVLKVLHASPAPSLPSAVSSSFSIGMQKYLRAYPELDTDNKAAMLADFKAYNAYNAAKMHR